jgi:hypothetical protein
MTLITAIIEPGMRAEDPRRAAGIPSAQPHRKTDGDALNFRHHEGGENESA